jgi:GntR family transcriptional regulator
MAVSGRLKSGERLPSVRQLADELAVNPMTISKAYSLLENEGLLERRRGVGMVLRGDDRSAEELIEPALTDLIRQARQLGLSRNKILNSLKDRWEETDDE